MNAPFVSMGEARRVCHHQSTKIEKLQEHNREMKELLEEIARHVTHNDPPVWYPKPGEITRLVNLAAGFHTPKRKEVPE